MTEKANASYFSRVSVFSIVILPQLITWLECQVSEQWATHLIKLILSLAWWVKDTHYFATVLVFMTHRFPLRPSKGHTLGESGHLLHAPAVLCRTWVGSIPVIQQCRLSIKKTNCYKTPSVASLSLTADRCQRRMNRFLNELYWESCYTAMFPDIPRYNSCNLSRSALGHGNSFIITVNQTKFWCLWSFLSLCISHDKVL